jgi:hypothetical protein
MEEVIDTDENVDEEADLYIDAVEAKEMTMTITETTLAIETETLDVMMTTTQAAQEATVENVKGEEMPAEI